MIILDEGNTSYILIQVVSITGEFPVKGLSILGNQRIVRRRVSDMCKAQTYHISETGQKFHDLTVFSISGKGAAKKIRLKKQAFPILEWMGTLEYFRNTFCRGNFSGDEAHIDRNHRKAEVIAMFLRSGMNPMQNLIQNNPVFSGYVDIKNFISEYSENGQATPNSKKVGFTRLVGAYVSDQDFLPIYNTRNREMIWYGDSERKIRNCCLSFSIRFCHQSDINHALLFGSNYAIGFSMINRAENVKGKNCYLNTRTQFCRIYDRITFIPLNEFGIRLLKLVTIPDYSENVKRILFPTLTRKLDYDVFEYDYCIESEYIFIFLDSDINRLNRFKQALNLYKVNARIICFSEQLEFLKAEFTDFPVKFSFVKIDEIEEAFRNTKSNINT